MAGEHALWVKMRTEVDPFGFFRRIESRSTSDGTGDVTYCVRGGAGWIELKHLAKMPRKGLVIVGMRRGQMMFHEDWVKHGGTSCIISQVGSQYLLHHGRHARALFNGVPPDEFVGLAAVHGWGKFPTAKVIQWLSHCNR